VIDKSLTMPLSAINMAVAGSISAYSTWRREVRRFDSAMFLREVLTPKGSQAARRPMFLGLSIVWDVSVHTETIGNRNCEPK
jgi:hypothetical protein